MTPQQGSERGHDRFAAPDRSLRRSAVFVLALAMAASTWATSADAAAPAPSDDPAEVDLTLVQEALEVIAERYVDEAALSTENLTSGAIRGMVEALGDEGHTVYLTADELEAERDALDGRVTGIGVMVDHRSGSPLIISVVDGSPADLAGVRGGDVIISVDGADIRRLPLDDLADLIRGDTDTVVRLGLERPGTTDRLELEILRSDVEIQPASWALAPGSDVAIVRIVQFSAQSGREAREAIQAALDAGATSMVLDLRGNPGGFVDEALTVAGSFLDEGVVYLEQGRTGQPEAVSVTSGYTIAADIPLVVLVDYGTASSAEILAAALRDNDRAVLVGEPTFGTGTVLNTFNLRDGSAIRVGVSRWLTPDGETVFRVGISPDSLVPLPPGAMALDPGDLVGMTASDFERADDAPLRLAVGLIGS